MKKIAITLFFLGSFLGYAQHTKKKGYKKPVKKTYAKKKTTVKPVSTAKITEEAAPTEVLIPKESLQTSVVQQVTKVETIPAEKADYEKTAERLLKKKGWINNRNSALVRGVEGFVKGVYSGNGKIFVMLEVSNRSNINYDIQNISFITNPSKKKMNAKDVNKGIDTEEKLFIPIWSNQPETITKKTTQKMVFVFDKFTIAENKTLNAVLNENEGERNLMLEVKPTYILSAEYIN